MMPPVKLKNSGAELGAKNLERVREWVKTHLGGKQVECAEDLGLSIMAVNRHFHKLRAEWKEEKK